MTGKSHNSRTPFSSERMGEHTRPRVWFATPRREHWGKPFDTGARRGAREARALPFDLKPKPALSRRNQEQVANFPGRQGVAHQEQIRCPVLADGGEHV